MAHFILVHGMFHGGWCWEPLARTLRERGHVVEAPDLAGCGSDATPAGEVTLEGWARAIADLAVRDDGRPILVGHSRGGIVLSQAADLVPESIAALVYVAAIMLPDGLAAMDIPKLTADEGFEVQPGDMTELELSPDGKAALMKPAALERLYAPVAPALRDWAMPQVGAEPLGPLMTPVALDDARYGTVPRIYVAAARDRLLPYGSQEAMIARSHPTEVHVLDAEHQLILTHADELAALLEGVARRYAAVEVAA